MLAHVPILAHGAARRVLVIGGGDGGILRRCLMHGRVAKVTMVEIDRAGVDLCREYLPAIGGDAFDEPRAEVDTTERCRVVRVDRKSVGVGKGGMRPVRNRWG